MSEKSIILRNWCVRHPVHGEVMVTAEDSKLAAVVAAAKAWGARWTKIARECDCIRWGKVK